VLLWLTPLDVSYQVAGIAAGVAGLVYLIRLALVLTSKVNELNALTVETHHQVVVNGRKDRNNPTLPDQLTTVIERMDVSDATQRDLVSQVQTAVVLAQQAVEGQERIEKRVGAIDSQVTGINTRLDAGEKRFQKIDRATKALEDVARTQHPESYREPGDFED